MAYTNDVKPYFPDVFLLLESGDFILQEDTGKIMLDGGQSYSADAEGTGTYTNDSK
jgi:hypothetical protein